jgi:2-methylfumaryl-CoA hydratase
MTDLPFSPGSPSWRSPRYGRFLEEFEIGAVYGHPWEITVDAGHQAFVAASFLDCSPVFASAHYARALGFRDRPLHPLALVNFGLSFSVHDVSEQAVAHLAYIDVRFPNPSYAGDTLSAASTVLGVKPSATGERGVVHVRTVLTARGVDGERVVCQFERKVLVKSRGQVTGATSSADAVSHRSASAIAASVAAADSGPLRPALFDRPLLARARAGFPGYFEDFTPGDILCHDIGRTVSESEHMQLTCLFRNTHPLHFEEPYARTGFARTRVVYGGLVFGWVASLASRDTTGNALWDVRYDKGAHPAGVVAGDTLYAASRVLRCDGDAHEDYGEVTFKLVGTKNVKPSALLEAGGGGAAAENLFESELDKKTPESKVKDKVFEIERTVLIRKRV